MNRFFGASAVVGLVAILSACGPSPEELALTEKMAALETEFRSATEQSVEAGRQNEQLQTQLASSQQRYADQESQLAELQQRGDALEADYGRALEVSGATADRLRGLQASKSRLGTRLSQVQAELWAMEVLLGQERRLRSRSGAAHATTSVSLDRVQRQFDTERRLRSRSGAAHAGTSIDLDRVQRRLATEQRLRSRLGAVHADHRLAADRLYASLQTERVLRSRAGAALAAQQQQGRAAALVASATQVQAGELEVRNQELQTELGQATDNNERRWQNFASQLRGLADTLTGDENMPSAQ